MGQAQDWEEEEEDEEEEEGNIPEEDLPPLDLEPEQQALAVVGLDDLEQE